nr:MAG TPA: hypothetical protein [Caudoviricetes sp.]DAY61720.1 MAG TPA: hypothetical protein [Caudoviricetes sp.]
MRFLFFLYSSLYSLKHLVSYLQFLHSLVIHLPISIDIPLYTLV